MQYVSEFTFDPPVPFDFFPFNFIIWQQVVGMVHTPLSVGQHVLRLDVQNTIPGFGFIDIYHNTWNLTVKAAG